MLALFEAVGFTEPESKFLFSSQEWLENKLERGDVKVVGV
jgi:hypothetical protein